MQKIKTDQGFGKSDNAVGVFGYESCVTRVLNSNFFHPDQAQNILLTGIYGTGFPIKDARLLKY